MIKETSWVRSWQIAATAMIAVALIGVMATGCGEEEVEEDPGPPPCDSTEECEEFEKCTYECMEDDSCDGDEEENEEVKTCIEFEGDVDCDTADDCPKGMICENGNVCVEDESDISCETTDDCPYGRLCEDEICAIDPLGPYADPVEVQDGDYLTSMFAEARVDSFTGEVRIIDSSGSQNEEVDTGSIDCDEAYRCAVSKDLSRLLVIEYDSDGDSYDVSAAPLEGDPLAVQGDAEVFAESVRRPRIRGNGVAYERAGESNYIAYFQEYDGPEFQVATLQSTTSSNLQRSWDVDPTSGRAILFVPPDLMRLYAYVGTIEEGVFPDDEVVFISPDNYPSQPGSLYIGTTPVGFSKDGRLIAFHTTGPNDYEACTETDECSRTSNRCGSEGRCTAIEPTINIIDMEFADKIDQPCTSHEACGPVNRCDSGTDDFDGGTCQPQRITVGLPRLTQGTPSQGGCEATREDGSFAFTGVEAPLSFGADNRVYFVGTRDCLRSAANPDDGEESNIKVTSILAGDINTGEYENIFGNQNRGDFATAECWDDSTQQMSNPDQCNVVISNAWVSPSGDDIIYRATNPSGVSQNLADTVFDVWRVRRDGTNPAWLGQLSGGHNATNINAHTVD